MPPTIRDLLRIQELRLAVLTGDAALDRPITWVHTSELEDPTPFLSGGELLLTTGQFVDWTQEEQCVSYVKRLASADVAGLGFGLDLPHERTPGALVQAACEVGLPLLEVPLAARFMAIGKSVAQALAADEQIAARRMYAAQHALARAAVGQDGAASVGRLLARRLQSWVLVLDATDAPVLVEPASAAPWTTNLGTILDRLRTTRAPASATLRLGGHEVLLQSLGNGPQARGFLAVGRSVPFNEADLQVLNTAATLLSLKLEQSRAVEAAEQHVRTSIFQLLSADQLDTARSIAREICGALPRPPLRLIALTGRPEPRSAATELLRSEAKRIRENVIYADDDHDITLVALSDHSPLRSWLLDLPSRLQGLFIGISEPTGYDNFGCARRQAVQAAEASVQAHESVMWFAELGRGGLGLFMDPKRAQTFAAALLEPLLHHDRTGRGDLVDSVRAWLENNGQWDPASTQLGVHRHTLRQRIHKAEHLLDRPFDSPTTRAELWLALQTLDHADE